VQRCGGCLHVGSGSGMGGSPIGTRGRKVSKEAVM